MGERATIDQDYLYGAADAIRRKNGTSNTYTPAQFEAAIDAIPTGITPTGTINITENGDHDVTNYATASVNVSGGGGANFMLAENEYQTSGTFSYAKTVTITIAGNYRIIAQAYTSSLDVKVNGTTIPPVISEGADYTRLVNSTSALNQGDVITIEADSSGRSCVTAIIEKVN